MKHSYIFYFIIGFLLLIYSCKTQKKPITVTGSSRTIEQGQELTLNWEVTDRKAQNVRIDGMDKELPLFGSINLTPDTTTLYRFIVERKKDKPLKKTFKVKVQIPEIDYFKGTDSTNDETTVEVIWSVKNASKIAIEGYKKRLKSQGSHSLNLTKETNLKLVATNNFGVTVSKTHLVKIFVIEDFYAPKEVYSGDSAIISWKYKNCQYVTIDGFDQKFKPIDALNIKPKGSTDYNLHIIGDDGTERLHKHKIRVLPPSILYFTAPKTINLGDEARLSWAVKGVNKVSIEGISDSLPAKGQLKIKPDRSKVYTLKIKYKNREKEKFVKINIIKQRTLINESKSVKNKKSNDRFDFDFICVDRSDKSKQKLRILAVDAKGKFISGLAPPSVTMRDAKKYFKSISETVSRKSYNISAFNITEVHGKTPKPYDICLALDYSGSMKGKPIQMLESAVKTFIETKHDDDKISIVKFSDVITTEVPLNNDKNIILQTANMTGEPHLIGSTALYAGGDLGISTLDGSKNQKIMILFADGNENASFVHNKERATNAMQLVDKALKNNIRIHVIAYGDEVNNVLLGKIANLSGGSIYNINKPSDIEQVFKELTYLLRNYYEIVYRPINLRGSHKVDLKYNSLMNSNSIVSTEFYTGSDFDISLLEKGQRGDYWSKYCDNMEIISPPQAIAYFSLDESTIEDKYMPNMKSYSEYLLANKDAQAVVFGHTDTKGSDVYCMYLAQKRAEEIKEMLVANGISANRVQIDFSGKNHPVWEAEEYKWQQRENRRVEILLIKPKPEPK